MANLFVAAGTNNFILTSPDGITWTIANADDSSGNLLTDISWDGHLVYVAVGGDQLFSSIDGGVTWVSQTLPVSTGFGIVTFLGERGVFKPSIWDGTQFVVVGFVKPGDLTTLQGVVGTSPDGLTWTWTNVADSVLPVAIAFNGATYVLLDWRSFEAPAQKSRFYSATSPHGTWTLRFTSPTILQYAWLGENGSEFIAFDAETSAVAYSADGITWNENLTTGLAIFNERGQVIWDIPSSQWIVTGQLANGNIGLATSPTGAVFTTRIDTGAITGVGSARSVLRAGSAGNLFAQVGATGTGQPYTSTDNGITWSIIGPPINIGEKDAQWSGSYFVEMGTPPDDPNFGLSTTLDFITLTATYEDVDGDIQILRLFSPSTPPAAVYNNKILLRYMGSTAGFSLLTALPGGRGVLTLREIQAPKGGTGLWPLAGDGNATIMALTDDAESWILFAGTQDGSIIATAITQPLPTPADLPPELWNSDKKFRAIWFEGEDLGGFQVFLATDRQLNADGTFSSFPWGPFAIINNKVDCNIGVAKRIGIKLVHAVASALGVTPLITYINIDYDIMAEAN